MYLRRMCISRHCCWLSYPQKPEWTSNTRVAHVTRQLAILRCHELRLDEAPETRGLAYGNRPAKVLNSGRATSSSMSACTGVTNHQLAHHMHASQGFEAKHCSPDVYWRDHVLGTVSRHLLQRPAFSLI